MAVATRCAVTAYAEDVLGGRVVAGRPVRLAAARHIEDSKSGHTRGLRFDQAAADRAIAFFPMFLRLAEGEHAGKPFELQPWQQFIVGSIFGWKGADGYRRYRKAYIETSKGQGKSPMSAGIGLYGLVADGEAGAEIYAAAVTRDQSGILFTDAKRMVAASPALSSRVEVNVNNLAVLATNSFFRPVSSEARSLDGKRVHMALIDEVHEHQSSLVIDKMQAGTKGRRQPLILEITNAGYDRNSVCWQHHDYSLKVLEGILPDDGWFAFVCALDEGDAWTDEAVWPKVAPNLDISITRTYLREQVREAQGMPSKENIVKRLNFCVWTESAAHWLDMRLWDACDGAPGDLEGKDCYAGLDLSSTSDITALVLVFPGDDGLDVLPFFWVPADSISERSRRDRVPYDVWQRSGHIIATEGNVVDYDAIRLKVGELAKRYRIRELAIDRWNSTQLQTQLQGDGLTVVQFGQGFASMTAPTKELERLVKEGAIRHGGQPVLRWMASNVAVAQDAAGNIKPAKDKSSERIDGITAMVMGLDRATRRQTRRSVYEDGGVFVL